MMTSRGLAAPSAGRSLSAFTVALPAVVAWLVLVDTPVALRFGLASGLAAVLAALVRRGSGAVIRSAATVSVLLNGLAWTEPTVPSEARLPLILSFAAVSATMAFVIRRVDGARPADAILRGAQAVVAVSVGTVGAPDDGRESREWVRSIWDKIVAILLPGAAAIVSWQVLAAAPGAARVGLSVAVLMVLARGGMERPLWAVYAAGSTAILMPLTVAPELPAGAVTAQWLAVAGVASVVTYAAVRLAGGGGRLVQLEDRKQRFVALANHELRTPVAVVHSVLETLTDDLRGQLTVQQEDFLQTALECSADLVRRLEMLSQLQVLAEDPSRPDHHRSACADILAAAVAAVRPQAAAGEVAVECDITPEAAGARLPDMDSRCIFEPLLNNAVKFSPRGSAVAVVGRMKAAGLVLEVADRGPGIPPRLRRAVFESFYQPGDLLRRQVGGMGVGLALARLAALRMGASLHVESRRGGGTSIRVELPAIEGRPGAPPESGAGRRRCRRRVGWAIRDFTGL